MKAMTDGAILARLCGNVTAGRFDWRKYCTPQTYFGREVCVTPLLCSYGQIGYAFISLIPICRKWSTTGN